MFVALSTMAILCKWLSKLKAALLDQKKRNIYQGINHVGNENLKSGNMDQREQKNGIIEKIIITSFQIAEYLLKFILNIIMK